MPVSIRVKSDVRELTRALNQVERRAVPTATFRSLNRAIQTTRTAIVRVVSKETGLTAKGVRDSLTLDKARLQNLNAAVIATGRSVPLSNVKGVRKTARGISIPTPEGRKILTRAFFWKAPEGKHVFRRQRGASRLPIRKQFVRSIPSRLLDPAITRTMDTVARVKFLEEFERQLNRSLTRLRLR